MNKKLLYTGVTAASLLMATQLGDINVHADTTSMNKSQTTTVTGSAQTGVRATTTNKQLATVKPTTQKQYQANIVQAQATVKSAQTNKTAASNQVSQVQAQVTEQRAIIAGKQYQFNAAQSQITAGQREIDAANAQLSKAEAVVAQYTAEMASAQQQIADYRQQLADNQAADSNAQNTKITAAIETLTAQVASLQATKAQYDYQLAAGKKVLDQGQATINQAVAKLNAGQTLLNNEKSKLVSLNQTLSTSQAKLVVAQTEVKNAEAFLVSVKANTVESAQTQTTGNKAVQATNKPVTTQTTGNKVVRTTNSKKSNISVTNSNGTPTDKKVKKNNQYQAISGVTSPSATKLEDKTSVMANDKSVTNKVAQADTTKVKLAATTQDSSQQAKTGQTLPQTNETRALGLSILGLVMATLSLVSLAIIRKRV